MATFGAWIRSLHTGRNGDSEANRYSDIGADARVYSARLGGSLTINRRGQYQDKDVVDFYAISGTQTMFNSHPVALIREVPAHKKPELMVYIPSPLDVQQNYSSVILVNRYTGETSVIYREPREKATK